MSLVPMVIEQEGNGERAYDIFSRLLKDRIIVVSGVVESGMASVIIAQLKYLNSQDPEKPIEMIIDSPGGHVTAGLAIYDTMRYGIKAPVSTIACGLAASMGAILLAGGTKGMRIAMPNSEIMIHQPSGGTEGTASDIMIQAASIQKTKDRLNRLLAEFTGQDIEKVTRDTDRDFSMTAEEALAYGLVDRVLGQA